MGCKQRRACEANQKQNFKGTWDEWQCRPWKWWKSGPSVCRQCCDATDDCARDFVRPNGGNGPIWNHLDWNEKLLTRPEIVDPTEGPTVIPDPTIDYSAFNF